VLHNIRIVRVLRAVDRSRKELKKQLRLVDLKRIVFLLALVIVLPIVLGCASPSKEEYILCPKCGSYFSTEQGAEQFRKNLP